MARQAHAAQPGFNLVLGRRRSARARRRGEFRQANLQGNDFQLDVKAVLDVDRDGKISPAELRLDTPAKTDAIRSRLERLGVKQPRIQAEIQPYSLHHGVATGSYAVRDCGECHGSESRVTASIELAGTCPAALCRPWSPTRTFSGTARCP